MPLPQFQDVRGNDEENSKMIGVLVNVITVLIGSTIGTIFKKGLPERLTSAAMVAIGLCTVYIGISGCLEGENTIVLIISMVLGGLLGTLIDIDKGINTLGRKLEDKISKNNEISLAKGFVSASLLFCVGAMTIVGSLNAGLKGDNELLLTKALLDLISSTILASTLGIGVMFASVTVLVYQGLLVLLAGFLAPFLTTAAIAEITCAGSLLILALGLNLLKITDIKVANFLPAMLFAPIVLYIAEMF